jgi:hypothetical protein
MTREEPSKYALVGLPAVVVISVAVRTAVAWKHTTARFFPDEYIYAALGRSISHGHLAIRGTPSHFPALLEPLVAAPIWGLFPTVTAYHLVQMENALAASLACVPIYLLSRYLRLTPLFSFACAIYSLSIPALVYIPFTMADPLGYPLALAAATAAVHSLDHPSPKKQIFFVALAGLATFDRVQYAALFVAYIAAAILVERSRFARSHWVLLASLSPVAVGVLVAGPSRILGYYSGVLSLHIGAGVARWFLTHAFLLSLDAGVVLVPGAIAMLIRPRGRREAAFASFFGSLLFLLLLEASTYAAQGPGRFKERYLFVLLPLLAVAFGLHVHRRRSPRTLVFLIAAMIAIAAAKFPLSEFASGTFKSDSPFLTAIGYVQEHLGVFQTSLIVAGLATLGAVAAAAVAFAIPSRRAGLAALTAVTCMAAVASAGAVAADLASNQRVRAKLPHDLTWIDDAATGSVTAIATLDSSPEDLFDQLYWNASVQHEVVLGGGMPTDAFGVKRLRVAPDGRLVGVGKEILFHNFGTSAVLANGKRVASARHFSLWRTRGVPRLAILVEGRFWDDWLAPDGRIRGWSFPGKDSGTTLTFRLSLPRTWPTGVDLHLGRRSIVIRPGSSRAVVCRAAGPVDVHFSSADSILQPDFRPFTVRLSRLRIVDASPANTTGTATSCSPAK